MHSSFLSDRDYVKMFMDKPRALFARFSIALSSLARPQAGGLLTEQEETGAADGPPWHIGMKHKMCFLSMFVLLSGRSMAQTPATQEAWPDSTTFANGQPVTDSVAFEKRRQEILHLFEENVYGRTPSTKIPIAVQVSQEEESALHGLAIRKQITLVVGTQPQRVWHLLVYLPAHAHNPVPVIIGLNFNGNHTVSSDVGVALTPVWNPTSQAGVSLAKELTPHKLEMPKEQTRGSAASQWQLDQILNHGYGLATMYAGEIEPDFYGGFAYGIRPLMFRNDQQLPDKDGWGAIGAWAWGMSRIADVLSSDPSIDHKRFVAFGFSRLGKTALWAAAQDLRFQAVLSNESGQAGATLSHRQVGESIDHMMLAFPYWFSPNYQRYLGRTQDLPVDGHLLLALIAPRALYVGSAASDPFSDPMGEFLAVRSIAKVYALFGETGIVTDQMPKLDIRVGEGAVRYHMRTGGHDVTAYDWQEYLEFLDRQFGDSR